jgi:hypothetical protein
LDPTNTALMDGMPIWFLSESFGVDIWLVVCEKLGKILSKDHPVNQ